MSERFRGDDVLSSYLDKAKRIREAVRKSPRQGQSLIDIETEAAVEGAITEVQGKLAGLFESVKDLGHLIIAAAIVLPVKLSRTFQTSQKTSPK